MTTYTRADWKARAPRSGPGPLSAARVVGLAFHWPAMTKPLRGFAAVAAALRSWQSYHMDTHGWSDIAYQVAVDQDGNRYELRGLRTQSAANGDTAVNETFGAVLLVVAPGEQPSTAMIRTVKGIVAEQRRLFPSSRRLVGHGQIRPEPTACPGPAVQGLINSGAFKPGFTRGKYVDIAIRNMLAAIKASPSAAARAALRALRALPRRAK